MDSVVSERVHTAFDNTMEKFRMRPLIAMLCLMVASVWAQDHSHDLEITQSTDFATSLGEWRKMAEQGQAIAQYNVGITYEYGRGVRQNDVEAVKWYKKASAQGVAIAQYRLGVMYDNGWGVPPNDTEAVKWYSDAAEQGHTLAQHDLAFMYVAGTGVARDYVRAYMWLNVAVASGNRLMVKHLDSVSGNLTLAQIEQAEQLAREWIENHK
jgi:TPR repeat protein